jgi:hypothetical protein
MATSPKSYFDLPHVEHYECAVNLVEATGTHHVSHCTYCIDGPIAIPQVEALFRLHGFKGWDEGEVFYFYVEPPVSRAGSFGWSHLSGHPH